MGFDEAMKKLAEINDQLRQIQADVPSPAFIWFWMFCLPAVTAAACILFAIWMVLP